MSLAATEERVEVIGEVPLVDSSCGSNLVSVSGATGSAGAVVFGNTMDHLKAVSFLLALALAFPSVALAVQSGGPIDEDWANSPEAYFLTAEERREWRELDASTARDRFKARYWLKRDPTPSTEKNEFRDVVLGRIRTADGRFPIGKTPGSRTARGMLFVVLGSPARATDAQTPRPEAPRAPVPGGPPRNPVGAVDGTETTSTWVYDRERTPRLLEALGKPSLEITVVVEPNRRRDQIQNPGLFNEYREILAKKSIVNPDLVPPEGEASQAPPREAVSRVALSAAVRSLLEKAPSAYRGDASGGDSGTVFGSAVVRGKSPDASAIAWFFLPSAIAEPEGKLNFHALIRRKGDNSEVATVSEPASLSTRFSTAGKGIVVAKRFQLPPGEYDASFAVVASNGRTLASSATSLRLPDPDEPFTVSSLLLAAGAAPVDPGADGLFVLGKAQVPPRADAVFSRSESLWYFLEIGHAADPSKVGYELRLRRGAKAIGVNAWAPAELSEVAPGRHVLGLELPLKDLEPGDYTLYVSVRDGEAGARQVVRRGDFRLVAGVGP